MDLALAWQERLKHLAEATVLRTQAIKVREKLSSPNNENGQFRLTGEKHYFESIILTAVADKKVVDAQLAWIETVLATRGNISIEWKLRFGFEDCHLQTEEVFLWDAPLVETTVDINFDDIWIQRAKLREQALKIREEGAKLIEDNQGHSAEAFKNRYHGEILLSESSRLTAQGEINFLDAVIAKYGKNAPIVHAIDSGIDGRQTLRGILRPDG
jgi:hypothetical protein